jgi:phage FluMu gp28-like protein
MSYFLPYQQRWIDDPSPLKIIEKSRQIGITYADAYDSVIKRGLLFTCGIDIDRLSFD